MIEELIALTAGEKPKRKDLRTAKDRRRARRGGVDLLAIEARIAKRNKRDWLARAAKGRKRAARRRKLDQRLAWKASLKRQHAARRGFKGRPSSRGVVRVNTQWVRLLASLRPGRWYGSAVLDQIAGKHKALYWGAQRFLRRFLEKARNPACSGIALSAKVRTQMRDRGEREEPRYVWKLNRWGEDLREHVLDNLSCEVVNVLALPHAKPDVWV